MKEFSQNENEIQNETISILLEESNHEEYEQATKEVGNILYNLSWRSMVEEAFTETIYHQVSPLNLQHDISFFVLNNKNYRLI